MRKFKCNILGGFRLTDLNKRVSQNEIISLDEHVCETSKSVRAALKSNWMSEIFDEPTVLKKIEKKEEERKVNKPPKRQLLQKQKDEDKPVVPNFNEAEKRMRERQNDITTKGDDEILKSPVKLKESTCIKDLSVDVKDEFKVPNFDEQKKNVKETIKKEIQNRSKKRKTKKVSQEK